MIPQRKKRLARIVDEFRTYRAIQRHIEQNGGRKGTGPMDLPLWFRFKSRTRKIVCILVTNGRCWWGKPGERRKPRCRLCGSLWSNYDAIREHHGLPYDVSVRTVDAAQKEAFRV